MHRTPQEKDFIRIDRQFDAYYGYVVFVDGKTVHTLKDEDLGMTDPVLDKTILDQDVTLDQITLIEHCKRFRCIGNRYIAS